jgi:hypothetical protein
MRSSPTRRDDDVSIRSWAAASVLQKTNRILGNAGIRVEFDPRKIAPGWTDGTTVSISKELDPIKSALEQGFTPKSTMLLTSVNYHELAHILFTPRLNSLFVQEVFKNGWGNAFNILEDQAAETRFVKLYEPARHYFTSLVTNYMMDNQQLVEGNYVLVSGRLFLPKRFRAMFRDAFRDQKLLDDIDRIVAEYKACSWPDDQPRMQRLIEEFHRLLYNQQLPQIGNHELDHDAPSKERIEQTATIEEFVADEDDEQEPTRAEANDEPDQDDDEGDQATSGGDEDDGDDADHAAPSVEELIDAIEALAGEVEDELYDEITSQIDHMREEEREYKISMSKQNGSLVVATNDELAAVNRCVDEFRRFAQQVQPGWHYSQRTGKLDFRRYARAMRGDEYVYRRWHEGVHDALDFEVVFCLDQSGSMSGSMREASGALWVLKRTFEENDGVVTVLGFSDDTQLLSQRGERSQQAMVEQYRTIRLTYVEGSLVEANRVLRVSNKPLKLRVVVTDGNFHDNHKAEERIANYDFPTVMVGIASDVSSWKEKRNVIDARTINRPFELVELVKDLALRLSEERLNAKGML